MDFPLTHMSNSSICRVSVLVSFVNLTHPRVMRGIAFMEELSSSDWPLGISGEAILIVN